MTKTSLKTPSDPLRILKNKNIHQTLNTFPTSLSELASRLVRRFVKTSHVSHDERGKRKEQIRRALRGDHRRFQGKLPCK